MANRREERRAGRSATGAVVGAAVSVVLWGFVARAAPDLDVEVPPGSPFDWTRGFPVVTPGRAPLFPVTPGGEPRPPGTGGERSSSRPRAAALDVRLSSSFGLVRILTWDVARHLEWTAPGPAGAPHESLHWIAAAPLLRLALHRAAVSEHEVLGYLATLGEPALGVIEAAAAEESLREICGRALDLIGPPGTGEPEPLAAGSPRADLLSALVRDELLAAHPYDPEAAFGARAFLFGPETYPRFAAYAGHADPRLRRRAVSALGRYRTPRAARDLARLAATTGDPVVLLRALSALGEPLARVDPAPWIARLERTTDPVEQAALADALGPWGPRPRCPRCSPWARRRARATRTCS